MDKLVAEGKIAPDLKAAGAAAAVPTFSAGTAALDQNTGKPILTHAAPPTFTEGEGVAIPEDTASAGGVGVPGPGTADTGGKTAQQLIAEHQARLRAANGTTDGPAATAAGAEAGAAATTVPTAPASAPAPAPAPAPGADAAAEGAAQALLDAFADYAEFEIDDADLGVKIPIRVPKKFENSVKRGYPRRSEFDRITGRYREFDPILRPLAEDGRLSRILPLIQRALTDQAYGEYVVAGYERATRGLPLVEQARAEAAAAGAGQAALAAPAAGTQDGLDLSSLEMFDPALAESLRRRFAAVETVEQRLTRFEQERTTQAQQQAQQQAENMRRANEMRSAHEDLGRAYPDLVNVAAGPRDPFYQKALRRAQESGYIDAYGLRAGLIFGAQQELIVEEERVAATSSPAVAAIAQVEAAQLELAQRQAADASRRVGTGSVVQAPPRPLPQRPNPRNADGSRKTPEQFMAENVAYLNATRA